MYVLCRLVNLVISPTHEPEVGTAGIVAMVVRGAVGGIQPLVGQDLPNSTVFFEYGIPRGQICIDMLYIYIYVTYEFDMHRASNPVV